MLKSLSLASALLLSLCLIGSQNNSESGDSTSNGGREGSAEPTSHNSTHGIKFATDLKWTAKPTADLGTPGKKIIQLTSCPNGVNGGEPDYWVYISGTGTPEATKVMGGTCTGNGEPGTLQIETAHSHPPGYTISSASSGIQEASVAARFTPTNPLGNSQSGRVIVPPGEYDIYARTTFRASGQTIDFSGSIVNCYVDDSCLFVGDKTNSNGISNVTVINPRGRSMIVGGTHPFIEDNAATTRIFNVTTRISKSGGTFGTWVQVDDDQAFLLDGLDTSLSNSLRCDATYCGAYVTAPGPFNKWSAVGWLKHLNITGNCQGNGVDWKSGNTLRIEDSVIQGFSQFAVRTGTPRGGYGPSELTNVYQEVGNCVNPLGIGQAGVIVNGGSAGRTTLKIDGGESPAARLPSFANQPKGVPWAYYLVSRDVTAGNVVTNPWLVGTASLNGSGNVTITTPQVANGTDSITYDLLRVRENSSGPDTGLVVGPLGTGPFAVTTASNGNCRNGVCTFVDTQAPLKTYSIAGQSWAPRLNFWPARYVISGGASVAVDTYLGGALASDSTQPAVYADSCAPVAPDFSPAIVTCIQPNSLINPGWRGVGTMLFRGGYSGGNGNNISNWKGRLLFEQNPGTSLPLGPEHLVTLVDCNPGKTLFTPGHRPGNDPCDSFIGLDRGNVNFDKAGISLGAPGSLSNYIGNIGDGTNWKERLTANLKAFQVPITTNAPISSTLATGTPPLSVESSTPVPKLFVANHPSLQNCGKTENCSAVPVKNGQVVFGRVTLAGGIATVRNLNPGFSDSGSFQCTASDATAAANAANAVPISGSSIKVNGVARDVVSYICAGN